MTSPVYTPSASVIAKAQQLLHERAGWTYYRNTSDGVQYIAIPSGDHVHTVRRDGWGCSCLAYQCGRRMCSHRLAAIEAANHDALQDWSDDGWEPIPPHEQWQAEAWAAECRAETVSLEPLADGPFDDQLTTVF